MLVIGTLKEGNWGVPHPISVSECLLTCERGSRLRTETKDKCFDRLASFFLIRFKRGRIL